MGFPMNAFEQGEQAALDDMPKNVNPYSMFSAANSYEQWEKGWDKGLLDLLDKAEQKHVSQ